ncbi:MAG TPA: hypothetical protein VII25_08875 [Candidatus Acidoferrum sp.]
MCPFCMTTAALLIAGTASTGGFATFALKRLFDAKIAKISQASKSKEKQS